MPLRNKMIADPTLSHVNLTSHAADGIKRHAKALRIVEYNIPKGNDSAYFPETNVLVGIDEVASRSHTPMSKFIGITIMKA